MKTLKFFLTIFLEGLMENMDFIKEKASSDHFQKVQVIIDKHHIQIKELEGQKINLVIIVIREQPKSKFWPIRKFWPFWYQQKHY